MNDSPNQMHSPYRWVILAIMWATTFIAIASQFQLSAIAYKIIPDFNLTSGQFALVLTAPMLPAVLLSLAAGALADRFGVKTVVSVGFAFSVGGVYFRYAATTFPELFILMFLSGLAPALLNANAAKLLGTWFSREKMGTAMGIYFSSTGAGIGTALATTALFPSTKSAFITAGLITLGVWLLWILLVKAKPEGTPDLPKMPMTKYIGVASSSRNVWLVGVALMFFMGANMTFTGFLPSALNEVRGISPVTAGFMASILTFGTILGSVVGPAISDRIGRTKPFLAPIAVLAAIIMYISWLTPQGVSMWVVLVLLGVLMGISSPIFMSFPMLLPEIGPTYAGTAGGLIATLQLLGAVIIPSFIIAPLAGNNYDLLFALGSVSLLLVGVVAAFLPELGSKVIRETGSSSVELPR